MKVFTREPGASVVLGRYGTASNTAPALVPAALAAEFENSPLFRVEGDEDPTPEDDDEEG